MGVAQHGGVVECASSARQGLPLTVSSSRASNRATTAYSLHILCYCMCNAKASHGTTIQLRLQPRVSDILDVQAFTGTATGGTDQGRLQHSTTDKPCRFLMSCVQAGSMLGHCASQPAATCGNAPIWHTSPPLHRSSPPSAAPPATGTAASSSSRSR